MKKLTAILSAAYPYLLKQESDRPTRPSRRATHPRYMGFMVGPNGHHHIVLGWIDPDGNVHNGIVRPDDISSRTLKTASALILAGGGDVGRRHQDRAAIFGAIYETYRLEALAHEALEQRQTTSTEEQSC